MALLLACGANAPGPKAAVPEPAEPAAPKVQLPALPIAEVPQGLLVAVRIKHPDTLGIPVPNGAKVGSALDAFVALKGQSAECAFSVEVESTDAMVEALEGGARPMANGVWRLNSPHPCVIVPQPGDELPKMACSCEEKPVSDEFLSFAASSLWVPDMDSDIFGEVLLQPLRERLPLLEATKRQALMGAGAMLRAKFPQAEPPALRIIDMTFQEVAELAEDISRITVSGSFNEDQSLHGEFQMFTLGSQSWLITQALKKPVADPEAWADFWKLPANSTFAGVNFNRVDWEGPYSTALDELAHIGLARALNATPKQTDAILEIVPMLRDSRLAATGDYKKECNGFGWTIMSADGRPKDAVNSIDELRQLWDKSEHAKETGVKLEKNKTPVGAPRGSALYTITGLSDLAAKSRDGAMQAKVAVEKTPPIQIALIPTSKNESWFAIGCDAKAAFGLYKASKKGDALGGNQTLKNAVPTWPIHGFGMIQANEGPPATYYTDVVTKGMPIIRTVFDAPPGWFTAMKAMVDKIDPDFNVNINFK